MIFPNNFVAAIDEPSVEKIQSAFLIAVSIFLYSPSVFSFKRIRSEEKQN